MPDSAPNPFDGTWKDGHITTHGIKFPKHTGIIKRNLRKSLREGTYEENEAKTVLKVVRDDDRVLELGGGIGFMSTHIARNRNIDHVHVFEANPFLIPYIQKVHDMNGITNATVHNAILGDTAGTIPFYVRRNLLASSLDWRDGFQVALTEQIEIRDTNQVIKDIQPNVLVCDIEGAETQLLPKMDLSGFRAAIVEVHPQWVGPEGINLVFKTFMDAGFAYYARGSIGKVIAFRRTWTRR